MYQPLPRQGLKIVTYAVRGKICALHGGSVPKADKNRGFIPQSSLNYFPIENGYPPRYSIGRRVLFLIK